MQKQLYPYPASGEILEKLEAKHRVHWQEVEEVFKGKMRIYRTQSQDQYGESRYLGLGRTKAGRYLTIFFVGVAPDQAKVISARDMDQKERKWFQK